MCRVFLMLLLCIGCLPIGHGKPQQSQSDKPTTIKPVTTTLPSYCNPLNESKPNFYNQGRRISEAKCQEYIWTLNIRLEEERNLYRCISYYNTVLNIGAAIGGFNTGPGDYPHMGAIGWRSSAPNGTWVFKCGSSLISEKFVLTAAHCTKASPRDPSISDPIPKIVRLGDKNILDIVYLIPPTDVNIARIIVHPQYEPPKKYFDIALMELEQEVKFTRLIHPACLWTSGSSSKLGKETTLTGWGVVETGSLKISPELQAAVVDIFDDQTCNDLLKSSCNRNWCGLRKQLCAGKLRGGVDACQGDSGGPLQVKIPQRSTTQGQMHHLIGIISFGIGCAQPNLPGIYTRVSSFIDWIEAVVWANESK